MKIKIESDAKVQVLSHSFTVSPSQNAYTLQYSAKTQRRWASIKVIEAE